MSIGQRLNIFTHADYRDATLRVSSLNDIVGPNGIINLSNEQTRNVASLQARIRAEAEQEINSPTELFYLDFF
jgi:hypothetical protein